MSGLDVLELPKRQSLDRAAAESLRNAIVTGGIAPGSRLTEARIAEQFSMSRGTVRAALQRLVTEGLVVQRPYSGWDVANLSSQDAWELSTLRSSLEALAARLTAERLDDGGRAAIETAFSELDRTVRTGQLGDIVTADMALHRTVFELSGNKRLLDHYAMIANQIRLYIASSTMLVERATVMARHSELVDAILARDPDKAEAASRVHSVRSGEEIISHLKRREAEQAPQG
jgi:DNA-binding GntR family transcriptional regulator